MLEMEADKRVEITPEMVSAGVREFLECRSLMTETPEEAVRDIFTAMVLASPGPWRPAS